MSDVLEFGALSDIRDKVEAGERLAFDDGLRLYRSEDLAALGALAQKVRRRLNGNRVFYSVNLHINHTNICSGHCLFCAFSKKPGEAGGYALTPEEILQKAREAFAQWPVNEIHISGGHHAGLDLDYYLKMIRLLRKAYGTVYLKAFAAPEIDALAKRSGLSCREVLSALKREGLDGLPGGGGEIFASRVREQICADKIPAEEYLMIHRAAHELGLHTNATMLYGHIENDEDRVDHVIRLRALQDETRGFSSFVPLSFNPENAPGMKLGVPGGILDLKVYAVSRLLLDNIPHLKAHWSTTGLKLAQVALSFGVDDLGGTNLGEKIMHEAGSGAPTGLDPRELERLITSAGYEPCLVDSAY